MINDPYGSGPGFPFVRDGSGNFKISSGKTLVDECFHNAIATLIGERPMWKQYGNKVNRVLFSLEGDIRNNVVKEFMIQALNEVENRARVIDVKIETVDNEVKVSIDYEIIGFNDVNNLLIVERLQ
jgi:phage baseplate assembly protein W